MTISLDKIITKQNIKKVINKAKNGAEELYLAYEEIPKIAIVLPLGFVIGAIIGTNMRIDAHSKWMSNTATALNKDFTIANGNYQGLWYAIKQLASEMEPTYPGITNRIITAFDAGYETRHILG